LASLALDEVIVSSKKYQEAALDNWKYAMESYLFI
jgi:hypothetical protein